MLAFTCQWPDALEPTTIEGKGSKLLITIRK